MDRNLKALELDKILEMLAKETASGEAAALAKEVTPAKTLEEAQQLLAETDSAYVLEAKFGAPSFYGLTNVSGEARRAQAGGGLSMGELLRVAGTLRAIRSLSQWRKKSEGMKTALDGHFHMLTTNQELETAIFTAIQSEEEMADAASTTLASIRRKIKNASGRVRERLDQLIRSQTHQKHLQDAIVTIRSGRFVVPVKAEFRNEVPGLVHDSSASGATVFVEPMAVVEANNEIRVLQAEEREEINRILLMLSGEVGSFADSLSESYRYALALDLIFARGHLAYSMKAVMPKLNNNGRTLLHKARHPLIAKDKVVPTDINLGMTFDSLIITGPNTGGKTVVLKTIGLLTVMAMCGMMIPAGEESEIAFFPKVLVDIGDEQSIEQSLSTFSGHMTNIIRLLAQADETSLVLVDELGAGTDPVEGAALATAIIEAFRLRGVRLACTTHYAELKAYAIQTQGVENGCCEFDVASLRPTYRLLIGVPGKSNAFAISQRLGMPEAVVARARSLLSEENDRFEAVVGKLEIQRKQLADASDAVNAVRQEAERKIREAERARREAEEAAQKELQTARQEAARIVSRTRAQAEAVLSELEDAKRQRNKALSAEQKARMRAGMRQMDDLANPVRDRKNDNYTLPRPLKPGDAVLIYDIDKKATVLEAEKEKQVLVQAGIIKTRVRIENLRLLDRAEGEKQRYGGQRTVTKQTSAVQATSEVDIRGKNVEEGLMELDTAIDQAARAGLKLLTVIHGKGTGVLRRAVQTHLRRCQPVHSFRLGTYGEGEDGVTIVELK